MGRANLDRRVSDLTLDTRGRPAGLIERSECLAVVGSDSGTIEHLMGQSWGVEEMLSDGKPAPASTSRVCRKIPDWVSKGLVVGAGRRELHAFPISRHHERVRQAAKGLERDLRDPVILMIEKWPDYFRIGGIA